MDAKQEAFEQKVKKIITIGRCVLVAVIAGGFIAAAVAFSVWVHNDP